MDPLRRILVLCAFTAVVAISVDWPPTAAAQGRPLYVAVTDSKGAPKAGITASDLIVEVNGKAAAVTSVAPAAEPVSVIVVTEGIDAETISEIRKMMKAVVAGALAIHPDSRVGLMIQDGAAAPVMHPVTKDAAALESEISRFFQSSPNAPLLDSILVASRTLALEPHARRAIVAVTWGYQAQADVMSPEKLTQAVKASGSSLWALELGGREAPTGASELRVLSDVTAISGGRRERTTVASIAPLTERIMATLRGQYAVTIQDGIAAKSASPKVTSRTKDLKVLAPAWPADK